MIRYYVTDRNQGDIISASQLAIDDGINMIQIREKDLSTVDLLRLVRKILHLIEGTKTRLLVNDRVDVALAAGISGVHLPSKGLPVSAVRPLVDLVGVSTHNVKEGLAAERAGADFIVFGPVFETPGKTPLGLDHLKEICSLVQIPVLAIGGINKENASLTINAGASGVAGIRLFQH